MSAGWSAFKRATPRVRAAFIEQMTNEEIIGGLEVLRRCIIERGSDPCGINALILQEAMRRLGSTGGADDSDRCTR